MESVAEIWKDVKGFEGVYQVSSAGRVRSLDRIADHPISGPTRYRGRLLAMRRHTGGYSRVQLSGEDRYVHRLVLEAFVGPATPESPEVNHKNGCKSDNRCENLEYCTRLENVHHAVDVGLMQNRGDKHYRSKTSESAVRQAYELVRSGEKRTVASRLTGVPVYTIDTAIQGQRAGYEKITNKRGANRRLLAHN